MSAADARTPAFQRFLALFERLRPNERQMTVLTGAGLSTESGIPDFRSPGSPWRVHVPIGFGDFLASSANRAEAWRRKFAMDDLCAGAQPGPGHRALAVLAERGLVGTVVTQNIDGLHQAAGLDPNRIVELHGNGTYARCLGCGRRFELPWVRRHLDATGEAPTCPCGGFIKSATIAFGQTLRPADVDAALRAAAACELFLAIGSSLVVRPAARLPGIAKALGASVAIVNRESTPLDPEADVVIRTEVGQFLSALVCCS